MSRLLVISCSARKRPAGGLLPAIDRYDGPAFRVLRKYLREGPVDGLTVLVLSAKFGLIPCTRRIPNYDLRITRSSAGRMRRQVLGRLRAALAATTYLELGLCLGRDYRSALLGYEGLVPDATKVATISGGLGRRLSGLRDWLRASRPTAAVN